MGQYSCLPEVNAAYDSWNQLRLRTEEIYDEVKLLTKAVNEGKKDPTLYTVIRGRANNFRKTMLTLYNRNIYDLDEKNTAAAKVASSAEIMIKSGTTATGKAVGKADLADMKRSCSGVLSFVRNNLLTLRDARATAAATDSLITVFLAVADALEQVASNNADEALKKGLRYY